MGATTQSPGWYVDPDEPSRLRYWNGTAWSEIIASRHEPGWYHDPKATGRLRYWDGSSWTESVATRPPSADLDLLDSDLRQFVRFVSEQDSFPQAARLRLDTERARYVDLVANEWKVTTFGPVPVGTPTGSPQPAGSVPAAPIAQPAPAAALPPWPLPTARPHPEPIKESTPPTPQPPKAVVPRGPSLGERFRHAIAGDLALHGLAYLGILLLFAGLTGFVVFAWADVERNLRPVAEVAIPASLFFAGWYLRRRGADIVGRALVLGGGAVLPIVAVAAFVDGSGVPRDLKHGALVVVAATVVAVISLVYAALATRSRDSAFGYLAAPTLWLAVGIAALAPERAHLVGKAIAQIGAGQLAAIAVAVAVTAIAARLVPDHPVSALTLTSVIGGIVVVGPLALILGDDEGWPRLAGLITAAALILAVEGVSDRLPAPLVGITQAALLALDTVAMADEITVGWAAAVGTGAFLALFAWSALRRRGLASIGAAATGAVVTACVAFAEPWAAVVSFSALILAAHAQRRWPADGVKVAVPTVIAAVAPVGVAVGLAGEVAPGVATTVIAAAVALLAVARRLAPARKDRFLTIWTPSAAGTLALVALSLTADAQPGWLAATAGLAGMTLALSVALALPFRLWSTAATLVETTAFAFAATGMPVQWQAVVLGSAGPLIVIAARGDSPIIGHLGLVGHTSSLIAVGVAVATRVDVDARISLAITAALATAGFAVAAVRSERGTGPAMALCLRLVGLEEEAAEWFARLPALLAMLGLPATMLGVLDAVTLKGDALQIGDGLGLAAVGVVYTASTWLLGRHARVATLAADVGVLVVLAGAAVSAQIPWASLATLIAAAVAVAAVATDVRRPAAEWIGWAATGTATVRAASMAGLATQRVHLALFVWAGVVLIGALAWDRVRCGPRPAPGWVRRTTLQAPAILGSIALPIGLFPIYSATQDAWASWSFAGAGVVTIVALLTRFAPLTGAAWTLAAVGAAGFAPFDVASTSLTFVAWGAGLLVFGAVVRWWFDSATVLERWDLPAVVVGLTSIATGVAIAPAHGQTAWTWFAAGGVAFVAAWWSRRVPFAVIGTVLVNGAAIDAGHGWSALVLAASAAAAAGIAVKLSGQPRLIVQMCGVACTASAWGQLGWWAAWDITTWAVTTSLVGGAVACTFALATHYRRLERSWTLTWGGLGAVAVAAAMPLAFNVDAHRLSAGLSLAVGTVAVAMALGLLAKPFDVGELRGAAVLVSLVAGIDLWYATEPRPAALVVSCTGAGLVTLMAALLLARRVEHSPWLEPLDFATFTLLVTAISVALGQWPDRPLLVISLAAAGGSCAIAGVMTNRPHLTELAPPLLCGSWMAFASTVLVGNPVWIATPVGLALLADVGLARADQHRQGVMGTKPAVIAVEITATTFLILPALVQLGNGDLPYALVSICFGTGLAMWGAFSRVRRRLAAGAITVLLTVVLLLGLPLAHAALAKDNGPASSGGLWLAIASVGLIALLVAVFLEQGRQRLAHAAHRISEMTSGWE